MSASFDDRAQEIVARYPADRKRSAMMPLLYLAQSEDGAVTREGMQRVAEVLGLKTAEIEAVVTFYTMYQRPPCGKYVLSVCTNLSCALVGGRRLMEVALEELGEEAHRGVSQDGMVTIHEEECLAACDAAPVVTVNFSNYDRMSEDGLRELIEALRRGEPPQPDRGPTPGTLQEVSATLAGVRREGATRRTSTRTVPPAAIRR
ncbi:MAG: NADH-quinone oxidoreductase subunit NuoE [Actinobacteria bacterium]|nr:NADH-quinone oxidoreductase subunit NuoE [Actinomycetota bacterium]